MKKKLPPAKYPLPKFGSDQEAAEYLETHSVAEVWDQLPASEPARPSTALTKSIRERHARAKAPISLRLVPNKLRRLRKLSRRSRSATRRNCGCGSPRGFNARRNGADLAVRIFYHSIPAFTRV